MDAHPLVLLKPPQPKLASLPTPSAQVEELSSLSFIFGSPTPLQLIRPKPLESEVPKEATTNVALCNGIIPPLKGNLSSKKGSIPKLLLWSIPSTPL